MNDRALVTGGCGFVGRHLVFDLLASGHEVWVLDNLFTGLHPDEWLPDFEKKAEENFTIYQKDEQKVVFVEEDAINFFRARLDGNTSFPLPKFSEVYHLAAIVGGRAVLIEENPMLVSMNHVIDSLFFRWVVEHKNSIEKVLYVSTSVSYPKTMQDRGKHSAMKEHYLDLLHGDSIGLPESIYGWIKLAGEYLATVAAKKYGVSVVCVRPFSGYGEDQDISYPIPSIAARAIRKENPLIVWGSGDQGRDFIYIDDFVSALRIAIKNIHDGSAVNIGMGRLLTFKEVARIMAEIEGYTPEIKGLTEKVEGSFAVYSDTTLLSSLGWKPKYTVEEGFAKVLKTVKTKLEKS